MTPLILIGVCTSLAACGGSGAEAVDEAVIKGVITQGFTESNPASCDGLYTQALMEQHSDLTGPVAVARCEREEASPDDNDADAVRVSDLVITDLHATAGVAVEGGALDQATLVVELVREDGSWKLDRLAEIDYDRAALDHTLRARYMREGVSREEADCTVRLFHDKYKLSELERAAVTGNEPPEPDWGLGCFSAHTLRAIFVEGLREEGKERDLPLIAVDCVARAVRRMPAQRLRSMLKSPTDMRAMAMRETQICLAAAEARRRA